MLVIFSTNYDSKSSRIAAIQEKHTFIAIDMYIYIYISIFIFILEAKGKGDES